MKPNYSTTFASTISIDRYYDPMTDSFISVDPDVKETDQPYAFVNDDPLNFEDPMGLCIIVCLHTIAHAFDDARHFFAAHRVQIVAIVLSVATLPLDEVGVGEALDATTFEALDGSSSISLRNGIPNFEDPATSPGEGWEWKGNGDPGTKEGNWVNSNSGETLHPDISHEVNRDGKVGE